MRIQANSYDWLDEKNVTAWMKWAMENRPYTVRLRKGVTNKGLLQQFLVANAKTAEIDGMLGEDSTHPGVMEELYPCPPFC